MTLKALKTLLFSGKVRHIYDIIKLTEMDEIQKLLSDRLELKSIVKLTKETDYMYLSKRNIPKEYNPAGPYDFHSWQHYFTAEIKNNYEGLHKNLLYTNDKQDWDKVFAEFTVINNVLKEIDE